MGAPNGTLAQLTRHFVRHKNQSLDAFFGDSSPFACSATMDGQWAVKVTILPALKYNEQKPEAQRLTTSKAIKVRSQVAGTLKE